MKNLLSLDKFNEELVTITKNTSGSGRTKEVDTIYNDENPYIKSPAAYLLLKDKYKKAELDDIKKLFSAGIPVYRYKTNDPKLTRILVTLNNLQFLKHKLKELGEFLAELHANRGFLGLHDNSHPEDIKTVLKMSKKTFKKAIGQLYKDRRISIEEQGIFLK